MDSTIVQTKEFWDGMSLAIAVFSGLTTILLAIITALVSRYVRNIDARLNSHSSEIKDVKEKSNKALAWIEITETQDESRHALEAQRTRDIQQMRVEMHQLNQTLLNTILPAALRKIITILKAL